MLTEITHFLNTLKLLNVSLKCFLPFCEDVDFADLPTLLLHIKTHIDARVKLKCPYLNWSFSFSCKSSFKSHLSQYHRNLGFDELSPNHLITHNHNESSVLDDV